MKVIEEIQVDKLTRWQVDKEVEKLIELMKLIEEIQVDELTG